MRAIGIMIALYGFLLTSRGWSWYEVSFIVVGLVLFFGEYYLAKR